MIYIQYYVILLYSYTIYIYTKKQMNNSKINF